MTAHVPSATPSNLLPICRGWLPSKFTHVMFRECLVITSVSNPTKLKSMVYVDGKGVFLQPESAYVRATIAVGQQALESKSTRCTTSGHFLHTGPTGVVSECQDTGRLVAAAGSLGIGTMTVRRPEKHNRGCSYPSKRLQLWATTEKFLLHVSSASLWGTQLHHSGYGFA